jgi:hypothetical protein
MECMPAAQRCAIGAIGVSIAVVLAFAVVDVGCATAGSDPEAEFTGDGGKKDSSFGDGTVGDGGPDSNKESGPIFDAGGLCGDLGAPNTCETVSDLGTLALGDKKSIKGNINPPTGDAWFKVTFASLDDLTAHPHVVITGPTTGFGFHFEVVNGCTAKVDLACGAGEDASSADVTEFEDKWATDPSSDGGVPDGDAIIPLSVGADGTVFIRVFRVGGAPTSCDGFDLEISN